MRLRDKVAIITGSAAGIGRATAEAFVREGARVVVADRDGAGAEALASRLGPSAIATATDVSRADQVEAMVARCLDAFGQLDVLVNNAGFGVQGTVETTAEADWDALMAVNLKGVYLCSRFAIPHLRRRGGVIVNTASNTATVGIKDRAAYVASKGGIAALTRAMALDHAADGIRVNCVAPGVIASSYFDRMLQNAPDPAGFKRALEARAPMDRMGQPEEIANCILFLASDESSFATGAMFTVDGGMSTW
jgi:NAD(P)-dependent dehydrogenase (short-subunit alcohol dehydrogenase family)